MVHNEKGIAEIREALPSNVEDESLYGEWTLQVSEQRGTISELKLIVL